jgi:hypothetical protein
MACQSVCRIERLVLRCFDWFCSSCCALSLMVKAWPGATHGGFHRGFRTASATTCRERLLTIGARLY